MTHPRIATTLTLDVPPELWEPTGDFDEGLTAESRLSGPIVYICGVPHHLEAYEVQYNEDDLQEIVNPQLADELAAVYQLNDQCLDTAAINGREYVIALFPHGR